MSFKEPQWNLYKVDTICADIRFADSPSKNQKSLKVNMKSTIRHDIPSPDLLEGLKDGKIKENAKFFHSKVFKQGSLHEYT